MKRKSTRTLLICLGILVGLGGCVEIVFGQPISQFLIPQVEHIFLPRWVGPTDDVLWSTNKEYGNDDLRSLYWTDEDIARLKLRNPQDECLQDFCSGILSPSSDILITFPNSGAQIRDIKGNLLSNQRIPIDSWYFKIYFRPDEKEIAFYHRDSYVWTMNKDTVVKLPDLEVYGYSPNGRFLIASGEEGLAILDREQNWMPRFITQYDQVSGFSYSRDQQYLLTYGCIDGFWWESGFFCFRGDATLWDQQGKRIADFSDQDDVTSVGFTRDMQHVVLQGCDSLWTISSNFPIFQRCMAASTRYYDLQGNLEGIHFDDNHKIHSLGRW